MKASRKVVFNLLAVFLMILAVEAGLQVAYRVIRFFDPRDEIAKSEQYRKYLWSPFRDKEMAGRLFRETLESLSVETTQSLIWVEKEYHGKYVNVTSEGYRKTWNPEEVLAARHKTLYLFGGSTVWGPFARDEATIPSDLSRLLFQKGYRMQVMNLGQPAYTFAHELLHLILLLQRGDRPDTVLFYDGANDLLSAYQRETGLLPRPAGGEKSRENSGIPSGGGIGHFLKGHLMIYRTLRRLLPFFASSRPENETPPVQYDEGRLKNLSSEVVASYKSSLELLDHLSRAYRFKYLCFWQPLLFSKERVTEEERKGLIDPRFNDRELGILYRTVTESLRGSPHFFDLSQTLQDEKKTVYWDYCHLTEEGNEQVARKIMDVMEGGFLERR